MLSLYKINGASAGVLIFFLPQNSKQSKYGCHLILLTGIDKEIGNIITYAIVLVSHVTPHCVQWFINILRDRCLLVKKPLK